MKVSVVIPSYKVKKHIIGVIRSIPICVEKIYVVDDCCPDGSGDYVLSENTDKRVVVLKNDENLGVGGAVMHGYKKAIEDNMDIVIKLDGDGQMNPN